MYIKYRPSYWRAEFPIKFGEKTIIPDAIFKLHGQFVFLEVDNTQSIQANKKKIELYKELQASNIFQTKYGYFPKIMFVTVSEHKKNSLITALNGLPYDLLVR